MIISLICLLLLAGAVYSLIKTKPNLLLFDLMKEAFGDKKTTQTDSADTLKDMHTVNPDPTSKNTSIKRNMHLSELREHNKGVR